MVSPSPVLLRLQWRLDRLSLFRRRRAPPLPPIPTTTTPGSDVQVQIYLPFAGCVSIATQNAVHVRLQMGLCQVNITRRNEKVCQQQGRKLLKITLAQPPIF